MLRAGKKRGANTAASIGFFSAIPAVAVAAFVPAGYAALVVAAIIVIPLFAYASSISSDPDD